MSKKRYYLTATVELSYVFEANSEDEAIDLYYKHDDRNPPDNWDTIGFDIREDFE